MKRLLRMLYETLVLFGVDPARTICSMRGLPFYFRDLQKLKRQRRAAAKEFPFGKPHPCLLERNSESGTGRGYYFHLDLLIARRVYLNNPSLHVDVGSRIDGFVAHVASFRTIEVVDIRPLSSDIQNVKFVQADLMAPLPANLVACCDSLSCLHALEHFGLGRYGDPVLYDGYLLGLDNLHRILKKGGKFYFAVPIGPQRIEFNAHRVFSLGYLLELFTGKYAIDHFSFVDDKGNLHEDSEITESDALCNFGCRMGCGIFELTKL